MSLLQAYELDLTGENPDNIVTEIVTLTERNKREFHVVLPKLFPFFFKGVSIVKEETNQTLIYGKDYLFGGRFPEINRYTKFNRAVYSTILFLSHIPNGNYRIQYQTLGGLYVTDERTVIQLLKNARNNPKSVTYTEIVNKPIEFPPSPHQHTPNEITNYNELINSVDRIRDALLQTLEMERERIPDPTEILLRIVRLGNQLSQLSERVTTVQASLLTSTEGKISSAIKEISDKVDEFKKVLEAEKEANKRVVDGIPTSFNNLKEELKVDFGRLRTDLTKLIQDGTAQLIADQRALKTKVDNFIDSFPTTQSTILQQARTAASNLMTEKLNLFQNNEFRQLDNRLTTAITGKVSKSGDTMTGSLTVPVLTTRSILESTVPDTYNEFFDVSVKNGFGVTIKGENTERFGVSQDSGYLHGITVKNGVILFPQKRRVVDAGWYSVEGVFDGSKSTSSLAGGIEFVEDENTYTFYGRNVTDAEMRTFERMRNTTVGKEIGKALHLGSIVKAGDFKTADGLHQLSNTIGKNLTPKTKNDGGRTILDTSSLVEGLYNTYLPQENANRARIDVNSSDIYNTEQRITGGGSFVIYNDNNIIRTLDFITNMQPSSMDTQLFGEKTIIAPHHLNNKPTERPEVGMSLYTSSYFRGRFYGRVRMLNEVDLNIVNNELSKRAHIPKIIPPREQNTLPRENRVFGCHKDLIGSSIDPGRNSYNNDYLVYNLFAQPSSPTRTIEFLNRNLSDTASTDQWKETIEVNTAIYSSTGKIKLRTRLLNEFDKDEIIATLRGEVQELREQLQQLKRVVDDGYRQNNRGSQISTDGTINRS